MMNGSSSGSASSNSSARAIRIGQKIEEMQLATAACERARGFAFEHGGEQSIARIENQSMERTLRARAVGRGIFLEWQLKESVQLDGGAAANSVFHDGTARRDVPGAGKRRADGLMGSWAV